jgi:hypothetical protein
MQPNPQILLDLIHQLLDDPAKKMFVIIAYGKSGYLADLDYYQFQSISTSKGIEYILSGNVNDKDITKAENGVKNIIAFLGIDELKNFLNKMSYKNVHDIRSVNNNNGKEIFYWVRPQELPIIDISVPDDECGICLNPLKDGESVCVNTPCFHFFHCGCITEWKDTGKNSCPICRSRPLNLLKVNPDTFSFGKNRYSRVRSDICYLNQLKKIKQF